MATTPYTAIDGVLVDATHFNTHTLAIGELQAPNEMHLALATAQSLTNGTWTVATMSASPVYSSGSGLTAGTNGITVAATGRYQVSGGCSWAANATGFRFCGPGLVGAGSASVQTTWAGTTLGTAGAFTIPMSLTAGDQISLWSYQNSGGALNCTNKYLAVRLIA